MRAVSARSAVFVMWWASVFGCRCHLQKPRVVVFREGPREGNKTPRVVSLTSSYSTLFWNQFFRSVLEIVFFRRLDCQPLYAVLSRFWRDLTLSSTQGGMRVCNFRTQGLRGVFTWRVSPAHSFLKYAFICAFSRSRVPISRVRSFSAVTFPSDLWSSMVLDFRQRRTQTLFCRPCATCKPLAMCEGL